MDKKRKRMECSLKYSYADLNLIFVVGQIQPFQIYETQKPHKLRKEY